MRWWWVVAAVTLVVAWVVTEIAVQAWLERRIADRVAEAAAGQVEVEAQVEAFPVVTQLAVTGEVDRVEVVLEQVAGRNLGPLTVRVTAQGLGLDRGALVGGTVDITGIDRGRFRAGLATTDLPQPVRRALEIVVDGAERLSLDVTRDGLSLSLPLVGEVTIPLPVSAPCEPDVDLTDTELVLHCDFTEIPELLTRVAASDDSALERPHQPPLPRAWTPFAQPVANAANASSPPS